MIARIFFHAYIVGFIAGLIFPALESFFHSRVKCYRERMDDHEANVYREILRELPFKLRIAMALAPIVNFMFIIGIFGIFRITIRRLRFIWKGKFIIWLAGKNVKKHFKLRHWIVRTFFMKDLDFFYKAIMTLHSAEITEILVGMFSRIAEGMIKHQKIVNQAINEALDKTVENE